MDKLDYLINYFLKEDNRILEDLPTNEISKKRLYRTLVNIRNPKPISSEFLRVEDLANTYTNCLNCAVENNVKTISFPCIST